MLSHVTVPANNSARSALPDAPVVPEPEERPSAVSRAVAAGLVALAGAHLAAAQRLDPRRRIPAVN